LIPGVLARGDTAFPQAMRHILVDQAKAAQRGSEWT
jgi:hypothetical protein